MTEALAFKRREAFPALGLIVGVLLGFMVSSPFMAFVGALIGAFVGYKIYKKHG